MELTQTLASEFKLIPAHVDNIISLIDEGNTIPFIARYRKEMTGSCDDQVLRDLAERLNYLRNLDKRKTEISDAISAQNKMTPDIMAAISNAAILSELEDIYRPFRPKRRTRAIIARERGLEPLADFLFAQAQDSDDVLNTATRFVDPDKAVPDAQTAIAGALDIIAENLSDDADLRKLLRDFLRRNAALSSKAAKNEDSVYNLYYDFSEPVSKIPSHRILAVNRGEKEAFLKVSLDSDSESAIAIIDKFALKPLSPTTSYVVQAIRDAWQRLIFPSLEREIRNELTERAESQAIKMFAVNLKPLLMQPPLRGRVVLGLDPAYRTGCKLAVVDVTGKVLDTAVIYPTPPHSKTDESKAVLLKLIHKHQVSAIAIGNGTASGEAEIFVAQSIRDLHIKVGYMVVNEAGASVYSASKLAAQEFPDFDVSLRSAVSIARRLQDPLAELVKIDPKAIGVGQYQHDMPQARLGETLTGVVEACVNSVGVDVNTASSSLLSYISGISSAVAKNICAHREENGAFTSRTQLKKIPKLGPKAYNQCAGFLRIAGGKHILDNTAVHPESYEAAIKLLDLFHFAEEDVVSGSLSSLEEQIKKYGADKAADECGIGLPTLKDIVQEIMKPGRDIRDDLPAPELRADVLELADLKVGMELKGTVRNVIDFGVFVDIGVHQDGLVHISKLADRYVRHPSDIVKVGDIVKVWVLEVDSAKKRISLTMIENRD